MKALRHINYINFYISQFSTNIKENSKTYKAIVSFSLVYFYIKIHNKLSPWIQSWVLWIPQIFSKLSWYKNYTNLRHYTKLKLNGQYLFLSPLTTVFSLLGLICFNLSVIISLLCFTQLALPINFLCSHLWWLPIFTSLLWYLFPLCTSFLFHSNNQNTYL